MTTASRHGSRPRGTAIVLAGGRSARFGGDKLSAVVGGSTILERAIAAVSEVATEVIVAGHARGSTLPAPGSTVPAPGSTVPARATVRFVADREPFGGPLAALAGALAEARGDVAAVVGGDMPALQPAVLAAMLDRLEAERDLGAVTLAAPDSARRQVLPAAVRIGPALAAARAALAAGDRSLARFLDRLRSIEVPERDWRPLDPEGLTVTDVDTPADLEPLRATDDDRGHRA